MIVSLGPCKSPRRIIIPEISSYCPLLSGHGGGADTPAPPEAVEQVQYIDGKELLSKIKNKLYTVHCMHYMPVFMPHCKEITRKGIARLSPNFHIHVSVSF
jgi:hypothetical protein